MPEQTKQTDSENAFRMTTEEIERWQAEARGSVVVLPAGVEVELLEAKGESD